MANNKPERDWSYLWTTEKEKWFLVYHLTTKGYGIMGLEGENTKIITIRDKAIYDWVISKMLDNGNKVIPLEEWVKLVNRLPERKLTLANRLYNIFFSVVQLALIKLMIFNSKFGSQKNHSD